jgi:hypothetical protein
VWATRRGAIDDDDDDDDDRGDDDGSSDVWMRSVDVDAEG